MQEEMKVNLTPENIVHQKPRLIAEKVMHYCPGCSHGTVHNLLAEVIDELGIAEKTIGVSPVGCSVFAYDYIDIDWVQAPHGRAAAVATGAKRVDSEKIVFTYQGDGDLAAIGTAETIHACNRGENIVIIFINNAIYGMTGGQMAPTTLVGMKTSTTPEGRNVALHGFPFKIADMISHLEGVSFISRQAVDSPSHIRKAKKALKRAFVKAMENRGTSFVEFVATCSSGWKMCPVEANEWMNEHMVEAYPLSDIKDI